MWVCSLWLIRQRICSHHTKSSAPGLVFFSKKYFFKDQKQLLYLHLIRIWSNYSFDKTPSLLSLISVQQWPGLGRISSTHETSYTFNKATHTKNTTQHTIDEASFSPINSSPLSKLRPVFTWSKTFSRTPARHQAIQRAASTNPTKSTNPAAATTTARCQAIFWSFFSARPGGPTVPSQPPGSQLQSQSTPYPLVISSSSQPQYAPISSIVSPTKQCSNAASQAVEALLRLGPQRGE